MPGLVELHCHIGDVVPFDINEAVYLTNPGLRASSVVRPGNALMKRGVAGGVTTALFIPGSASNMGGQGVLLKLGYDNYEEMELRNPGALKLAQAGNPEDWTVGVARTWMNWNTRHTLMRGLAYAHAWELFEEGDGPEPQKDIQWEIFRSLLKEEAQIAAHTQLAQVVGVTISMVAVEMGLDVFIDHGSLGGHHMASEAEKHGVAAILGPRTVAFFFNVIERAPRFGLLDTKGAALGTPAEYQRRGHTAIGFNTDCVDGNARYGTPPQEELSLQAAMALRYGMTNHDLESLRGLTIVPAQTVGLGDRLGTLEPGKDADVIVITGDIADPRTYVERAYTDGQLVYDAERDGRRW
jgi:imidazolonepropionase-like amidohydrolase